MRMRSVVTLLLVASMMAACGGKPSATTAPTVQPHDTVVPTKATVQPTVPGTEAPTLQPTVPTSAAEDYDLGQSASLDKLDSYRAAYAWKWTETKDGALKAGQWNVLEEFSKADAARHSRWESTDDGKTNSFEVIQIGQVGYIKGEDGSWTSMLTSEQNLLLGASTMVSDPLSIIAGDKGKLVQRGLTVNGVVADHYTLSQRTGEFMGLGAVDKMSGDVYVSPQLQVVVKYAAHYEGKTLSLSGGTNGVLDVAFDLTDVNQPVKIVAPEGVEPPIADDIPIIEGATELSAMSGVISYKTGHTSAEVIAFYNQAMVQKGWQPGQASVEGMLNFVKGERQATIMIQAESGVTSVTVIAAK